MTSCSWRAGLRPVAALLLGAALLALTLAAGVGLLLLYPDPASGDTGVTWQPGSALTDQSTTYAAVQISDAQFVLFNRDTSDGTSKQLRIFQTPDFGVTLAQTIASANTGLALAMPLPLGGVYFPSVGQYVLGGTNTGGATAFLRGNAYTWAFPTITGSPAGAVDVHSLRIQGSTALALMNPGSGSVAVCKSSDTGSTWTCSVASGITNTPALKASGDVGSLEAVDSPILNTWLILDGAAKLWRSTDNGATFTNTGQLTADASPVVAVRCLSSSQCVAGTSNGTTVRLFQSLNGGLTWSAVFSATSAIRATTLVNVGQGVIDFLASPLTSAPTPLGFRSANFGATWVQLPPVALANPVTGSNFVGYLGGANSGPSASGLVQSAGGAAAVAYFCTGGGTCGVQVLRSPFSGDPATGNQNVQGTPGNPIQVQIRGAASVTSISDVTLNSSTATLIRVANTGRVGLTLTNNSSTVSARCADATVTTSKGLRLNPGVSITISGVYSVYCISESSTPTISANEDLQ